MERTRKHRKMWDEFCYRCELCSHIPAGRWSFLGPGSEKKWYGNYSDKPDGDWDKTAERMMLNLWTVHPQIQHMQSCTAWSHVITRTRVAQELEGTGLHILCIEIIVIHVSCHIPCRTWHHPQSQVLSLSQFACLSDDLSNTHTTFGTRWIFTLRCSTAEWRINTDPISHRLWAQTHRVRSDRAWTLRGEKNLAWKESWYGSVSNTWKNNEKRFPKSYHRRYGWIWKSWCRNVLHPVTDAFRLWLSGEHCRLGSWRWRTAKNAGFTTVYAKLRRLWIISDGWTAKTPNFGGCNSTNSLVVNHFLVWRIQFKIQVTTCSDFPSDAILWIKEVEMFDSLEKLKSSRSVSGKNFPNFEMLDAKIASALKKDHPEFPIQEEGQSRGTECQERRPVSTRKTDRVHDLQLLSSDWRSWYSIGPCWFIFCFSSWQHSGIRWKMGRSSTIHVKDSIRWYLGESVHIEDTWVRATQNRFGIVRHGDSSEDIDAQLSEDNGEEEYRSETSIAKFWRQTRENWIWSRGKESRGNERRWRRKRHLLPVERKRPVFERRPMQFPAWE